MRFPNKVAICSSGFGLILLIAGVFPLYHHLDAHAVQIEPPCFSCEGHAEAPAEGPRQPSGHSEEDCSICKMVMRSDLSLGLVQIPDCSRQEICVLSEEPTSSPRIALEFPHSARAPPHS
jgi:hypothetical protein